MFKGVSESQEDEFEAIWRERTAETEDEVISLAVSFSIVQMLLAPRGPKGEELLNTLEPPFWYYGIVYGHKQWIETLNRREQTGQVFLNNTYLPKHIRGFVFSFLRQ